MLFVIPNTNVIGGPNGVLEGVYRGCIYNWYEKIESVVPRVYHKYLRKYNPFGADGLVLSAKDGSADGKFVITMNEELEEGNSYFYKFTDKYPQPGEDVSTWDAWDGTTEFTAENGTSICIVEADAEGKAVKAGMVVVVDETDDLDALTVTSVEGTEVGFTKITVEPTLEEGNSYFWKAQDALPEIGTSVADWTAWDGVAELEIENGTTICVAEADVEGLAVKAGTTVVVAKPEPVMGTLTVISDGSETPGYTKITIQEPKLDETNQYFYKFDEPIPELNADVSDWTSWDGTSDIEALNGHTITVVEATAEGLAVAAGEANLSATLRSLTVTCEEGTTVGCIKVTVAEEKIEPGDTYMIQVGPEQGENGEPGGPIQSWDGVSEVAIPNDGILVTVSEMSTTSYQFLAKGGTDKTVAKKKDLTVSAQGGTEIGTVALTVTETAEEGHNFGYVLFDDVAPAHGFGTVVEATPFTSGEDVNVDGHAKVAVFELDAESKIYGYGEAEAFPREEVEPDLVLLNVTAADGTTIGHTKLTVNENTLEGENKYVYSETSELPTYNQDLTGWTDWNGTDEIKAATGTTLCVAEVTTANLAVKAGTVVADALDDLQVQTAASATTTGNTAITVTPTLTPGNKYFYKVPGAEEQVTLPNVGDTLSDWTEWNGTDELAIANGSTVMIAETTAEAVVLAKGFGVVISKVD